MATEPPAKRPNILLITSDQHRWDGFGFEGRRVKTPHLDRLAGQGTRFSACITPNLVCMPARSSILTGLLPLTHGVYDNGVDLAPEIGEAGWAGTLSKAGYRSVFIGKGHFAAEGTEPTGSPECRKSSADFGDDWYGPYMGFDNVELMILGHWHDLLPCERPPRGHHFERWFHGHGKDDLPWELWKQGDEPAPSAAQTWFSQLPDLWHSTTWVTDRAIAALDQGGADDPFCLWVSYPDPHHPFDCPEPWSRLHDPDDVDISRHHRRDLDDRPWWHRASLEYEPQAKTDRARTLRTTYSRIAPQTDRQLAEMTANYYGMISFIDHGVGRILAKLDELGISDNTLVVFTADHGELLGDHGLYLKGPTAYEGLLRVGMIMRGPGTPAGKVVDQPVSTIDLAATFYDYANADTDAGVQSTSLRPLVERDDATRDVAFSEWNLRPNRCGVPLELRTVRTRTAKLTVDLISDTGEMYDLADDPDEMRNIYDDPGRAALRRELTDMIRARPGPVMETLPAASGEA